MTDGSVSLFFLKPYDLVPMWQILDTGVGSAEENMRIDAELLTGLKPGDSATLHVYEWSGDSATYGYFVRPGDFLQLEGARKRGLQLARRPTGGGIVFHVWDMAFSVVVPSDHPNFSENTLENYHFVNSAVQRAVEGYVREKELQIIPADFGALDLSCSRFCMARPPCVMK